MLVKMEARAYATVHDLRADIDLIWSNALNYNPHGHWVSEVNTIELWQ